jgi:hypothetical protein
MMDADYYRERAKSARRLAHEIADRPEIARTFQDMALDYDEIAIDLETGAVEIRHPELMPQGRRGEGL